MSDLHREYRFSIVCKVTDKENELAVLGCLRALCNWANSGRYRQIGWGGSTEKNFARNGYIVLRFRNDQQRMNFKQKANELLGKRRWSGSDERNDDPAIPRQKSRQPAPG